MPRDYWHCPTCGGNFDHGEKCDCHVEEPRLKVSETLIIGIDISKEDTACLQVAKSYLNSCKIVNTFYGQEAIELYKKLCNTTAF